MTLTQTLTLCAKGALSLFSQGARSIAPHVFETLLFAIASMIGFGIACALRSPGVLEGHSLSSAQWLHILLLIGAVQMSALPLNLLLRHFGLGITPRWFFFSILLFSLISALMIAVAAPASPASRATAFEAALSNAANPLIPNPTAAAAATPTSTPDPLTPEEFKAIKNAGMGMCAVSMIALFLLRAFTPNWGIRARWTLRKARRNLRALRAHHPRQSFHFAASLLGSGMSQVATGMSALAQNARDARDFLISQGLGDAAAQSQAQRDALEKDLPEAESNPPAPRL